MKVVEKTTSLFTGLFFNFYSSAVAKTLKLCTQQVVNFPCDDEKFFLLLLYLQSKNKFCSIKNAKVLNKYQMH